MTIPILPPPTLTNLIRGKMWDERAMRDYAESCVNAERERCWGIFVAALNEIAKQRNAADDEWIASDNHAG